MTTIVNSPQLNGATDRAFIHIVKRKTSIERLIQQIYYQSSPENISYFLQLNTHVKNNYAMPGQAVIIVPPQRGECGRFELELMDSVQRIEKQRQQLTHDKREMIGKYYGLLDNTINYSGLAYGLSVGYFSNHAKSVNSILKQIEKAYVLQFNQQGHFSNQGFFVKRNKLFQQLESTLQNMVGKALAGPDIGDHNIRHSLGLSSKSILHTLREQKGVPIHSIPKFEANYTKISNLSKTLKHAGHFGIALDVARSTARIHQACTVDEDQELCGRTSFKETGRVAGNVVGGGIGGAIAYGACNLVFGLPSAGSSLLWCGIVVGASSGYVASNVVSGYFENKGAVLYETLINTNGVI